MNTHIARTFALLVLTAGVLHAQVPQLIHYQGRVAVGAANFDGTGQFKFARVDPWATLTGAPQSDNGPERTVTDTSASGPRKFYRVKVEEP